MNTMAQPRVSVLMTTYNGGPLVKETIDSIRSQTLQGWELVIVDDCSTDDTYDVIARHVAGDPRIRLFRNEQNQGISRTRNRALSLARAPYVAATDQDDLSMPKRLERQVAYLDAHPEVVMVATAAYELRGKKRRLVYKGEMRSHVLAWRLFTRCSIVHSSVCMRRSVLDAHGLRYEPEFHYAEDFVLFHKLSRSGAIKILPEELTIYRETPDNASTRHSQEMNTNGVEFLQLAFQDELGISAPLEDFATLWSVFNSWAPAPSEQALFEAGHLYADALGKFCERRVLSDRQEEEVRMAASGDWFRAVATHCIAQGRLPISDLFRKIEQLSAHNPSYSTLFSANLRLLHVQLMDRATWFRRHPT